MLSIRSTKILNSIVGHYITRAVPLPSQVIADDAELGVSPATVRNEMAHLEQEGYLIRPHTSAGCIPSDRGYRLYVESIVNAKLPAAEERLISHIFHQVEKEVESWVRLTATLLSRTVQNVAVVSMPKSSDCKLKHLELLSLQDTLVLAVIVLHGARVKQKLLTFDEALSQSSLTAISTKLNGIYSGLTGKQISTKSPKLSPVEQGVTDHLVEIMEDEDNREYEEPCLDGWHFMLNQPEFSQNDRMRMLMELVEQRKLLEVIIPEGMGQESVHVIIGEENKAEAIQNCSVVISRYGIPDEATGTIGVVGPTRMAYSHTIPTVHYFSTVLSELVASLYGKEIHKE